MKFLSSITYGACVIFAFLLIPQLASADFSPSSIPNLSLWLEASAGVTTDGTTPATNGQQVEQWDDQSGNSVNATQSTSANQPIFESNVLNGQPVLRFDGDVHQWMNTSSFLNSSYKTAMTYFIVDTAATTTFGMTTSNQDTTWYTDHTGPPGSINFVTALTPYQIAFNSVAPATTVSAFRYDGATESMLVNGLSIFPQSATGNLSLNGGLAVGDAGNGDGYFFTGDIAEILIYKSVLSDAQIQEVDTYLMNKYDIPTLTELPGLQFIGDSMTNGLGNTPGQTFPEDTFNLLGGSANFEDYIHGLNGFTVQSMITDIGFSTAIDNNFNMDDYQNRVRPYDILILMGGVNDILNDGDDPPTLENYIQTYVGDRKAAGYKVIVNTIMPFNQTGSFETNREAVNAWLRANWRSFADGLSDLTTDPNMGQPGQATGNPTYYQDGLHPTDLGAEVLATHNAAAVNQLLDPIVVSAAAVDAPTASSVNVSWSTNHDASTYVNFGTSVDYSSTTDHNDSVPNGVTSHTFALADLSSCTLYHYQAASYDLNGMTATSSDNTFTTTGCPIPVASSGRKYGQSQSAPYFTTTPAPGIPSNTSAVTVQSTFTRNLAQSSAGNDVMTLQKFLNSQGFTVASTGAGSSGNETSFFGALTQSALIKFQKAYGITPSVGYFGPKTRSIMNIILKVKALN